jgi:hypothetical protein
MMMVEQHQHVSAVLRIRRALALPIYILALLLDLAGAGLGWLAAAIAGDDWPEQPLHDSRKAAGESGEFRDMGSLANLCGLFEVPKALGVTLV